MRKLLLSILALVLCQPLMGALVTLPDAYLYPRTAKITSTTLGTVIIDADTDEVAAYNAFPKSGTLTDISFTTATTTTADADAAAFGIRIETIGTDGNPSGTLYVANATGGTAMAAADDNIVKPVSINSGTGVTVAQGALHAVRGMRRAGGTFVGAVFRHLTIDPLDTLNGIVSAFTTGAWVKISSNVIMSYKIDGTWYSPYPAFGGISDASSSEAFADDSERGIGINLPFAWRIVGAQSRLALAAATTFKFTLYSAPTVAAVNISDTPTIDTDMAVSTSSGVKAALTDSQPTQLANTLYVLAVTPLDATAITLIYFPGNATYRASYPGGTAATWYARDNVADVFVETTTRLPLLGVVIDAIDVGSSSTGKFISEGMRLDYLIERWKGPQYTRMVIWGN